MVDNQPQPDPQQVQAVTGIAQVRLLLGHVDADTAYVQDDYPYGHWLRCRIRYWIDTATRGDKSGWQRFVSQTTNPRRPGRPWNHPKERTYAPRTWMYLDADNHVQHTGLSRYGINPHEDARLRLMGIYHQMPEADRNVYDQLLALSQALPERWERWEDNLAFITEHLRQHANTPPEVSNGVITRDDRPVYLGDEAYPIAVAVARLRLAGLTMPSAAQKGQ
jgi:hypothetical protein